MKFLYRSRFLFLLILSFFLTFSVFSNMSYAEGPTKFAFNKKLPDVEILGGPYKQIFKQSYDHSKYDVHHLLSKSTLNNWSAFIKNNYGYYSDVSFIHNKLQSWAPAILMLKEDHMRTLSNMSQTSDSYNSMQLCSLLFHSQFIVPLKFELNYINQNLNEEHIYDKGIYQAKRYIYSLKVQEKKNGIQMKLGKNFVILPTIKSSKLKQKLINEDPYKLNFITKEIYKNDSTQTCYPFKNKLTQTDIDFSSFSSQTEFVPPPTKRINDYIE